MEDKLKVLFISTQLPYPAESGGKVKSWNYLIDLSKRYELSLACFLKDEIEEKASEEFQQHIHLQYYYSEKLHVNRNPLNLIKSYLGHACLNTYRNYSASFQQKIKDISPEYDVLLIDHYEMFQYVPADYKGKVIMHTHNAEFMLWYRMAELSKNPLMKLLLKAESRRVKKFEQYIFKKADLIYATPSDIQLYHSHQIPIDNFQPTFHLGNDQMLKLEDVQFEDTELAITFMGTLSWEPNVDGLLWFIENIWQKILDVHPNIKLYVMGKKGNPKIYEVAKAYQNIIFTGFIKDLDSYLKKTRVYIIPLRFGSGMKVKTLEGLYRGIPMVSTSIGAEGLAVEHQKDILIANTVEEFAESCISLVKDQETWNQLRNNSRKIAAEKYQWTPLFDSMDLAFKKLIPQVGSKS